MKRKVNGKILAAALLLVAVIVGEEVLTWAILTVIGLGGFAWIILQGEAWKY